MEGSEKTARGYWRTEYVAMLKEAAKWEKETKHLVEKLEELKDLRAENAQLKEDLRYYKLKYKTLYTVCPGN